MLTTRKTLVRCFGKECQHRSVVFLPTVQERVPGWSSERFAFSCQNCGRRNVAEIRLPYDPPRPGLLRRFWNWLRGKPC